MREYLFGARFPEFRVKGAFLEIYNKSLLCDIFNLIWIYIKNLSLRPNDHTVIQGALCTSVLIFPKNSRPSPDF